MQTAFDEDVLSAEMSELTAVPARILRSVCQMLGAQAAVMVLIEDGSHVFQSGEDSSSASGECEPEAETGEASWVIRTAAAVKDPLSDELDWTYHVLPCQGRGLLRESLVSRQIVFTDDPQNDARFDPESDVWVDLAASAGDIHALVCIPIMAGERLLGAIQAVNQHRIPSAGGAALSKQEQVLLANIGEMAASILFYARQAQDLKVARADREASQWEAAAAQNILQALFDHLPVNLYIVDSEYSLKAINQSRAQLAGQPPEALVGKVCYQALFGRSEPCSGCRVAETLREGLGTQWQERRWKNELQRSDEPTEWEIFAYPIQEVHHHGATGQAIILEQDITEKRRLEAILTQSEKLAAVGQLAAGIAHEINNPLTAIIANAQILHRELPPNDDLQESVELIARAGARAAQVVRNLLDFARKEQYYLGVTDLNETLRRALELIQHELISRGASLTYHADQDLPSILASADQLQSVWLNLLLNAIDSLDKPSGQIQVNTCLQGREIRVVVSDNGKGIPAENLTRIFEPFYTTKAPGRGTGLGLAVSHRIISQHGGYIRVESQVGAGSTFTVILPVEH
ncbi:MAG: GAF domain-containing protein [Anaerolineales bacterium]|nr:GAF domain-containing protein [Anaerolineales bacterium]